ncbi:MAG: enoyl-CoA hydratase/isomerase family protein [Rhodospirillaceae bacterium]|nr:MAG: enoyl-CoA hydratase/isomerase family protein [Rhodospirillaceae bacterium]
MSVDCSISDGVATILLNRPDKLNAITYDMWGQLAEHLDRCQRDDAVRAIILTGAGRGFCAGADISGQGRKQDAKTGLAGALDMMAEINSVIRRLYHMPKPTIAAVRGAAIGISWTMALCCDWILVTEGAKFRPAFMNLAKVPEGGIMFLMSRLIGALKARDIIYRARFVSGREAVDLGLATQLVSEEALMDEAVVLARELAAGPPLAFALTKRLFNADAGTFDQFVDRESNAVAIAANIADATEGMAAFREKRAARFTGR